MVPARAWGTTWHFQMESDGKPKWYQFEFIFRDFLENNLLDFATNNPGVAVYVKPRRHRMPVAVAEYLSGDRHWICLRDSNQEGVTKWLNLLLTQNGNSSALRLRRMSHTEIPSIQGAWTPYTHANPALNTTTFPAEELSKPVDIEKSATDILLEYFAEQKQQQQLEQQSSQLEEKTAAWISQTDSNAIRH